MPAPAAEPNEARTTPRAGQISALLKELVRPTREGDGPGWEHAPTPGAVVGRFELIREIGRGSFGVVYEARDRELGRRVAFKAVRAGPRPGVSEERLLREAEAAARLSHPNIVTLFDVGRSEGGAYLVFELLEGVTLESRVREEGRLTVPDAVHIGTEVARALAHAHAHGVVHRDLKPANVLVCTDGRVKVLDFGLAHAFGHRRQAGGTPGYMPPEQAADAPEDERSDVWALGVMLFEMLSGQRPFADERSLERPAPALEVPGLPAVGELVARMLAVSPMDRLREGAEVLSALERIERRIASVPALPAAPVRIRRSGVARHRFLAAGVAVALVFAAAVVAIVGQRALHGSPERSPSIAVLAFADLSPRKDQEYLGDGMAEEILNALSRVQGLRVIGRTSSFSFKGRNDDLRTIARQLDVTAVLEGSVRRMGERVRIAAKLVRAQDGSTLWAESFDRDDRDLFATQEEIARSVTAALRVTLLQDRTATATMRTDVPEAYAEVLRGRRLVNQGVPAAHHAAIQAFERAVALDPRYAPAYSALSVALFNLAVSYDEGGAEVIDRSRALVERALSLAPTFAEAYAVRASHRMFEWDWAGAREDVERALTIAPNDLRTRFTRALLLAAAGHTERAVEELRSVVRDDPLSAPAQNFLARFYLDSDRSADARRVLAQMLELEPRNAQSLYFLAATELHDGNPGAALAMSERIDDELARRYVVGLAQHDLGHEREAQEVIDWMTRQAAGDCSRYCGWVGGLYAYRGERDAAFAWLEKAIVHRAYGLYAVRWSPTFRKIRDDPRFRDLLRRMNLPVDGPAAAPQAATGSR